MTSMNSMDQGDRDEHIVETVLAMYPGTDRFPPEALLLALNMGASAELMGSAGGFYVDLADVERDGTTWENQGVRLRYVAELLEAGHSRERVRELFEYLALTDDGWSNYRLHLDAFWNDEESYQALYRGDPEATRDFVKKYAAIVALEVLRHHRELGERLGNRDFFEEVMVEVCNHLGMIETEEQLQVILRLPIPARISAALRTTPAWEWSLVLKGYVLSRYTPRGRNGETDFAYMRAEMQQFLADSKPEGTPARWRWIAEGFRRGWKPQPWSRDWREQLNNNRELRWIFEAAGLQFLKVQARPQPGGAVLEVTMKTPKGPVTLRHDPTGPRGEQLKHGDLVVVSPALVKDMRPAFRYGGGPGYILELHAADVPTQSMRDNRRLATK